MFTQAPKNVRRAKTSVPAVEFREATFDDYGKIFRLEDRFQLGFKSFEEWSHLWVNNPVYKQVRDWPIGWVLENRNGEIVGSIGNIPLRYEFGGAALIAAAGHAWVADEQYRTYALMLLNQHLSQTGVDLYLETSVNANSEESFARLRCLRVPAGAWDRAGFWVTNYRGFVGSALTKKSVVAARALAYPLSPAMFLIDRIKNDPLRAIGQGNVRFCAGFDERFDDLWENLRTRNPGVLLGCRDRETLNWHFRYALAEGRAWILTVDDGPRLAAYSIFLRKDARQIGLRRVRLIDFQSSDGGTSLLLPMLAAAVQRCREEKKSVLENIGWRLDREDTIAPHQRVLPSWQYYYKAGNPGLDAALEDRTAWNPTQYDGDITL